MMKHLSILATIASLAAYTAATPAQAHPSPGAMVGVRHFEPNVAQLTHQGHTIIEARQYHNADYGSNQGPTGNPHPADAQATASAPASNKAQATQAGSEASKRDAHPAVGKDAEPESTQAHPVNYTQED